MSTIEMQTREAARPAPGSRPDRGPVSLDRRGDARARGGVDLSPVAGRGRRDRGGDPGGAGTRSRYRRHPPRGFPAADAGAGAGPAARRGAGRPRLCAAARHAGRRPADRRERHGVLGHRRLFRQRPLAERQGPSARACLRSRQGLSATNPNLRSYATAERQNFHIDRCDVVALLCLRRAKSGGLSTIVSSMTRAQRHGERRPDLLERLYQPFPVDRRGEVPEGKAPFYEAPVFNDHAGQVSVLYSRLHIGSAQRFPEARRLDARGHRGARHAGTSWRATRNCGST